MESVWYTIEGRTPSNSITQLSGTINQSLWDVASYGEIFVVFYAEEIAGNTGHSELVVEKFEKRQVIPGYSFLVFFSVIGALIVIFLKKKDVT